MFKKNSEFKVSCRGIDRVIEEEGRTYLKLCELAWGYNADEDAPPEKIRLDLRKYTTDSSGNEKMLKGVSFMTEQGPHNLVHTMIEEGYGDTETIIDKIKTRDDFEKAVKSSYGEKDPEDDSFDLRDIL